VDLAGGAVVAEVAVGREPMDIGFDDATGRIFTADLLGEKVTVVDGSTLGLVASVPVGLYPSGLALDAGRRRLYCGCALSATLAVIDLETLEVVDSVEAQPGAGAVAVDGERSRVHCANFLAGSLTVVDAQENSVVAEIEVGAAPCALAVSLVRGELYVANSFADTVTCIDLETSALTGTTSVDGTPVGAALAPAEDRLYVSNRGAGTVSVVGFADRAEWARIPVGEGPGGCTVDRLTGQLLVANAGSGSLTVIEDLLARRPPALPKEPEGRQYSCRYSSERGVAAVEREFGPLKARVWSRSFGARSLARVRLRARDGRAPVWRARQAAGQSGKRGRRRDQTPARSLRCSARGGCSVAWGRRTTRSSPGRIAATLATGTTTTRVANQPPRTTSLSGCSTADRYCSSTTAPTAYPRRSRPGSPRSSPRAYARVRADRVDHAGGVAQEIGRCRRPGETWADEAKGRRRSRSRCLPR
jgi:YVTN family beta-propeller protein